LPEKYTQILETTEANNQSEWQAEKQMLGFNHADIGGHLLKLWGLPDHVVAAVVFHHEPTMSMENEFSLLTAVHVANYLVDKLHHPTHVNRLDRGYIEQLALTDALSTWESYSKKPTAA